MEEIIEKIRELVGRVAPTLNTSPGSPFDRIVLDYIREQFGVGELDLDLESMIINRIHQLDPDIVTAPGSAVHEFLIKELSAIFAVPRLEIQRIKRNQDLNNIEDMTDAEVDRRMSMFFRTRRTGDVAIGKVRAYFASPSPVTVNLSNRALTADGKAFLPDGTFTYSRSLVSSNKEKGLYYVDIQYVAEQPGDQYNIEPGAITTIENLPGLVRATNITKFVGGVPPESNEEFVNRTLKSLSERSLGSKTSIISVITDNAANQVMSVSPIGYGDPEMQRDAFVVNPSVTTDSIKLIVDSVSNISTFDLAHTGIDYSRAFNVYLNGVKLTEGVSGDFVVSIGAGANGVDRLTFNSPVSGILTVQYILLEGYVNLIKDLPGSIETPPVFPIPHQYQVVHVGGKVDIYIKPSLFDEDELLLLNLDRFTLYKTDIGRVYQDSDGFWYFETESLESTKRIGASPGDIVQIVTEDPYGNIIYDERYRSVIHSVDPDNDRYRLVGGPSEYIASSITDKSGLDVAILMGEERALPLNRLIAEDKNGDPIYLPINIDPLSSSDSLRQTSLDPQVNAPVLPSSGYILRDTTQDYPKPFQRNLPVKADSISTLFAKNGGVLGSEVDYEELVSSEVGKILYFAATENISSGNIKLPLIRLKSINFLNPLSLQKIPNQSVSFRLPVDVRSNNVSGGVDKDSDFQGIGREASGLAKIYFLEPTTVILYGPGSEGFGKGATRFTRRVEREVSPGKYVTFNLVYRLSTTGDSGGPSLLITPKDFKEENGLWYFEVPIVGESSLSTRSDSESVNESDLNLDDGEELYIGHIPQEEELVHVADPIEYGFEGAPSVVPGGNSISGVETPASARHPYLSYSGSFSGNSFVTSPSLDFINNEVQVGSLIRILEPSTVSYLSDTATFDGTDTITVSSDLEQSGVEVGDYLILDSGSLEGEITEINGMSATIKINSGSLSAGSYSLEVFKWSVVSNHRILGITDESTVVVSSPSSGASLRFVVVAESSTLAIKNPFVRKSTDYPVEGESGNEPNSGIRTEGYWIESRNPFDRLQPDNLYTYSVEELPILKYTEGADTRYLPDVGVSGEAEVAATPKEYFIGSHQENLEVYTGSRVIVRGTDYEIIVAAPKTFIFEVDSSDTPDSTATNVIGFNLPSNSVYEALFRVFLDDDTELEQVPYSPSTLTSLPSGSYTIQQNSGSTSDVLWVRDDIFSSTQSIKAVFKERLDQVVINDNATESAVFEDGILTLDLDLSTNPRNGDAVIKYIIENTSLFAVKGSLDRGGDVLAGTYEYESSYPFLLSKNFASRQLSGKDISITYEWSQILKDVHDFVTSSSIRSVDQDVLVRSGIPVFANVKMRLVSSVAEPAAVEEEVSDYLLKLDNQPIDISELVRLPKTATSVPLPVEVIGINMGENRIPKVLRSDSAIEVRRIDAVFPNSVNISLEG